MSHPGSIFIDEIDFAKVNYLTNDVTNTITNSNFNIITGKPLNNMSLDTNVDQFFIDACTSNLFENKNINNDLIYKSPKLLEIDSLRDLQVGGEVSIDAVFIMEGASMKNMFGYYMYTIDENGNKRLLSNDVDSGGYYYTPTIVFPHVYSVDGNMDTLQKGEKRRLKGNLPNGNFSNVYIGFFLVPHGWYAFEQSSDIYNDGLLYSTIDFNRKYRNSEYVTINDKIYSVYFKAKSSNGHELLLTGFEDIIVNGIYDLDYNDCVVGFEISDVTQIVDYDKYAEIEIDDEFEDETENTRNNIISMDDDGEYLHIKKGVPKNSNLYFERHMCFNNESDRDISFNVLSNLLTNYKLSITKEHNNGKYKVVYKYLFRVNDLNKNKKDKDEYDEEKGKDGKNKRIFEKDDVKIYLFESRFNRGSNTYLDNYKELLNKNMNSNEYCEQYKLYNDKNVEYIRLTDTIDKPYKTKTNSFKIIGNGVMDCVNGKSHLPADKTQIYRVYQNSNITINVKMDTHPTNYMIGKKTFVRYVSFKVNSECVVIDLANLNLYTVIEGELVLNNSITFNKINISSITYNPNAIKDMVNIFRNDSGAFYRTITLNGHMVFYCVRLPNVKNNPTLVYLDSKLFLDWNTKYNGVSGTYFYKQRLYMVNSFTD